jgi:hypothetical protein
MTARRRRTLPALGWAELRACFLAFPGVVEGVSYGTPAFRVGKTLLARLHQDGNDLVLRASFEERETLVAAAPDTFHVTDHYVGHPWVLVRLRGLVVRDLERLVERAWRAHAPQRAIARFDGARE